MLEFQSRLDNSVRLHRLVRREDICGARKDVCPPEEPLQMACLALGEGTAFRAHKHILQRRTTDIAQEAWIVIAGSVQVTYYDLDDSVLAVETLAPGDCSITFRGGHAYTALSEGTLVYECKTGPYQGQAKDKVFI
jgi:cupin fold WbuC family metalloprotein